MDQMAGSKIYIHLLNFFFYLELLCKCERKIKPEMSICYPEMSHEIQVVNVNIIIFTYLLISF